MKAESFDTYVDIPQKTKSVIEVVVSDSTAPKQRLVEYSWLLSYPKEFPVIPENTRNIFQQSKAEFSIAMQGYVEDRAG